MKFNKWTLGLAAVGVVSLTSVAKADEHPVSSWAAGTTISVTVDASVETTLHDFNSSWSLPNGFSISPFPFRDGKSEGINVNVVEINFEKALDETQWSSGYRVSIWAGPDANGFNPSVNSRGKGDFAIKEAYVNLLAPVGNGLEIKVGVFNSPLGYESTGSWRNPNMSYSFGYAIEPTQLTGVLLTYRATDNLSISAGIANTVHAGINTRDTTSSDFFAKTAIFSATGTAPESWGLLKGASASIGLVYGFNGYSSEAVNLYAGVTVPLGTAFSVGAAFDYLNSSYDVTSYEDDDDCCWEPFYGAYDDQVIGNPFNQYIANSYRYSDSGERNQGEVSAYVFGLYGKWQATEKLALNVRGEYARIDLENSMTSFYTYEEAYDNQFGTGTVRDSSDFDGPFSSSPSVDVIGLTGTISYQLWANVLTRAEVRYNRICASGGGSAIDEVTFGIGVTSTF